MDDKIDFFNYDVKGLEQVFVSLGEKPFRARQAMSWIYRKGVFGFEEMSNFSKELRLKLSETTSLELPDLVSKQESSDGTVKLLLAMKDGELVETVLIPDRERLTQCVSTQAGCAMGCSFCRTGTGGLRRNLTAGEIVAQVLAGQRHWGGRVTNVVFMGMGEPLHNFDNTVRAFFILSSDWGVNIAKRRLTISTCGLVDKMGELPPEVLPSLAISLNATTDEVRDRVMPVNRKYPIAELLDALARAPLPHRARYTIEYVLLGGVNDTLEDAKRLAKLLSRIRCKVNLIPYNPHEGSEYRAPAPSDVERFQTCLLDRNYTAVLRKSRGADILAACGQLKAEAEEGG